MTFDEFQDAWEQADHVAGVDVDEATIEQRVREQVSSSEWEATVFEFGFMACFGLLGVISLADAIIDREPLHSYASALISLGVAFYVYFGRVDRLSRQSDFAQTMVGYLEQGIGAANYQVSRVQTFLWWFVLPSAVAAGINMYYTFHGRPLWVWIIQPLALLLIYVVMQVSLRTTYLPKKATLESLRSGFLHPAEQHDE
jgi:hypothetical protein